MGVCQKNCAVDYSKCLITTFDMATCTQQEAGCALDCLKSTEIAVEASDTCSKCIVLAGGNLMTAISQGCGAATETAIVANCQVNFERTMLRRCEKGFSANCNTFLNQITNNVFSAEAACKRVGLC